MSPRTEPLFALPEPHRSAVARAQWVLAALDPAQRRHHIERYLNPWVTWLVHTYRLRTVIPPCWYRHPDITERLKNLMAAWIATFTDDPGDHLTDRPFAYVEFDDALERQLHRITIPPTCLDGDHEDPPTGWATDDEQPDWLTTSEWATADPADPAPEFADTSTSTAWGTAGDRTETAMTDPPAPTRPAQPGDLVMSRAHGDGLVTDGVAKAMRDYAIFYDGAWWLGDQATYVRVTDPEFNRKLDFKALKLARADQAVTRTQHATDQDAATETGGQDDAAKTTGRHPATGDQAGTDAYSEAADSDGAAGEGAARPDPQPQTQPDAPGDAQPYVRSADPGEESS